MFEPGSPAMLLVACAMGGLCVALLLYVILPFVVAKTTPVTAALDEAQRKVRRERATQQSDLLGFTLTLMPVLVPLVRRLPLGSLRESLAQRYAQAGWPGGLEDDEVLTIGLLLGVVLGIPVGLLLLLVQPLLAPLGLVLLVLGPGLVSSRLAGMADSRAREITRTMPYVLDMLVLAMRAGAAFPIALERVSLDFSETHIGREFRTLLTDLERGTTMREGLTNMAYRAPVKVVENFTDDLIHAAELGRPVADALERLSDRVRELRVQEAVETAGRARVLVLIPGMLVFLAVLLLLFAPFIIRAYYGGYSSI